MAELYSDLSREILQQLRGSQSQSELSQKLGFSFNQVGKWEAGATALHWEDFGRVCDSLGIPWQKHFEETFSDLSGLSLKQNSVFEILSQFFGHASVNEMATRLNKSRSSISRLMHDQVKIDFADVLRMMDQRSYVLNSWLAKFIDLQKIPSLKERAAIEKQMFLGLLSVPWSTFVNSALGLESYRALEKHSSAAVARKTGLSEAQVDEALAKLVETGLIEKRDGKYHGHSREMTTLRIPEARKMTQFLGEFIVRAFKIERPLKPNLANPSLSSQRVYPLSDEGGKKLADAMVKFHHEVSEIFKQDKGPKSHVRAVLIHSVDMELLGPTVSENDHAKANLANV